MGIISEPILVVALHGDAPRPYEHPSYPYIFASKVAAANKDVVAVGLLRPLATPICEIIILKESGVNSMGIIGMHEIRMQLQNQSAI